MDRFEFYSFEQAQLLQSVGKANHPGVCAALCAAWLESISNAPELAPARRLLQFAGISSKIISAQDKLANEWGPKGPEAARKEMGQDAGLDYDEQTQIVVAPSIGLKGIEAKVGSDLRMPGFAVLWEVVFKQPSVASDESHQVAGFCAFRPSEEPYPKTTFTRDPDRNIHYKWLHIFEPNLGEYGAPVSALGDVLQDINGRLAYYSWVHKIHRIAVQQVRI